MCVCVCALTPACVVDQTVDASVLLHGGGDQLLHVHKSKNGEKEKRRRFQGGRGPGSPGYHPLWKCHMGQTCRILVRLRSAAPLILYLPPLKYRRSEVSAGSGETGAVLHLCWSHDAFLVLT